MNKSLKNGDYIEFKSLNEYEFSNIEDIIHEMKKFLKFVENCKPNN